MSEKELTQSIMRMHKIEYEAKKAEAKWRKTAREYIEALLKEREHRPRIFSSKNI